MTDGRTDDGRTDGKIPDGRTDENKIRSASLLASLSAEVTENKCRRTDGRTDDGRTDAWTDGRTDARTTDGRTDGRMTGGRTDDGRTDGRKNSGRMDGRKKNQPKFSPAEFVFARKLGWLVIRERLYHHIYLII